MTPKPASTTEERLARIEEKLDGLDARLQERCSGYLGRIQVLEKSMLRQGERIGRLEAETYHAKGGRAALLAAFTLASAAGGLLVKVLSWLEGI